MLQVLHQTDHNKPAWDELVWAVKTGEKPFEKTHGGLSAWEWLKKDPREEDKFSKAMQEVDSMGKFLLSTPWSTVNAFQSHSRGVISSRGRLHHLSVLV